jgi:hypothetical protein
MVEEAVLAQEKKKKKKIKARGVDILGLTV